MDLMERIAAADESDPEYDYLRGRIVAVRDAEQAIHRLASQGESVLSGLAESHEVVHEAFPVEE